MNVYLTQGDDPAAAGVKAVRWSGSQADAGKNRKELKLNGFKNVATAEKDIPTNKSMLLDWLNSHKVIA